jgi:hypothetical protein
MDAASFAALTAVLGHELPPALEDALLNVERSRMRQADEEARNYHLLLVMARTHHALGLLQDHMMHPNAWFTVDRSRGLLLAQLRRCRLRDNPEIGAEETGDAVEAEEEDAEDEDDEMSDD